MINSLLSLILCALILTILGSINFYLNIEMRCHLLKFSVINTLASTVDTLKPMRQKSLTKMKILPLLKNMKNPLIPIPFSQSPLTPNLL